MSLMEQKKKINESIVRLEERMEQRYSVVLESFGRKCFKVKDDEFFVLSGLSAYNAIVIEYAESEEEARKNMFEDGDLFFLTDNSEDEMFEAMISEIEN